LYQVFESSGLSAALAISLEELPVIKVWTIAQAETSQKVIAIKLHRLGKRVQAGRTNFRR